MRVLTDDQQRWIPPFIKFKWPHEIHCLIQIRGKSFEFITIINHLRISLETDSLNKKYYIYSTVNKVEKEIKT